MPSPITVISAVLFGTVVFVCDGIRWSAEEKICVKAKENGAAYWRMPSAGRLRAVKLTHVGTLVDSYVTCDGKNDEYKSFWGCNMHNYKDYVNIHVTDLYNSDVFPVPGMIGGGYYKILLRNNMSPVLVLGDVNVPDVLTVQANEEVKIWYGEDLYDHGETDNNGTTCMMAQAYITQS